MKPGKLHWVVVFTFLLGMAATSGVFAQDNSRHTIPSSKFGFVSTARDLGPAPSSQQVTVYLWLQLHNADSLRDLVEQQYDPGSGNYHNWLTPDQFNSTYAPTAEEVATVKEFLAAHNLGVSSVGDRNMYVTARGSIVDVQRAFSVQVHQFNVRGQVYRANTTDPVIEGPAGALVSRVGGLSDYRAQHQVIRRVNPQTGQAVPAVPLSATAYGASASSVCLQPPELVNFYTGGGGPRATYFGNTYGTPVDSTGNGDLLGCGYKPSDLQTGYNLNSLYNSGLNGAGQGVVIIDPYGSPTLAQDAKYFSDFFGLPKLHLSIYNACPSPTDVPEGVSDTPPCPAPVDEGGSVETTLDVESAHTVAPGANIALVYAYSDYVDDLGAAILFAVSNRLGNSISNSWGLPESALDGSPYTPFNDVLMVAAAEGISVNFASGDSGDWYALEGFTDVSYPASSDYATAVGGTSLFLNRNKTMAFQTGWGTNGTIIANAPADGYTAPFDPPIVDGFIYGSGGGASAVYSKPSFQRSLPGNYRLLPDTSFLGDPYTGMEILCTASSCYGVDSSDIYLEVIGGTSLSCPMFSAIWAIANQRSGRPLGQAARSLYSLPANAFSDVVPVGSPFNVSGSITANHQTTYESALQLILPETTAAFVSALWQASTASAPGPWVILGFGTNSSLFTKPGWDDVTGLGTPNGLNFVNAVAPHR